MTELNGWTEWLAYDDCIDRGLKALHIQRYMFARQFCRDKVVLDAGCGGGYGSRCLAEVAKKVVSIDVSDEAIDYARRRCTCGNVEFRTAGVLDTGLDSAAFDVVVSLEVIEHLEDPLVYLNEMLRVLRPDGCFVISTPNAPQHVDSPSFDYHHQEFTKEEIAGLLERHFGQIELYGQGYRQKQKSRAYFTARKLDFFKLRKFVPYKLRYSLASRLLPKPLHDVSLDDLEIVGRDLDLSLHLVCVCRRPLVCQPV
jgi:2-polyprenyl-3-methyl-5-hydroxy-6-metoxy-1,4-benzoquinol methylase